MRLNGKVAIVVGAGSIGVDISNGAAAAVTFAREGATVLCVDRSLKAAQDTVQRIKDVGGRAETFEADVQSSEQINTMVKHCHETLGRIDILHYNVGIEEFGELTELTEESWNRVHAINLTGAMLSAKAVVPRMIEQGGGSIINVSSLASMRWGQMQFLSYNTSKAALNHMSKMIARQYAKHQIRCNALVAGLIDTPHVAALFKDEDAAKAGRAARNAACPMGRQGTPWDIANAALFLASDEAAYVTGLEFVVDGGISL